jgi:hypothetical protein
MILNYKKLKKLQASSFKPQAPSNKQLDMKEIIG